MPALLIIDNYDSFTWNLYQAVASHPALDEEKVHVVRNDALSIKEIWALQPCAVIVSPGPGLPEEAGISLALPAELLQRSATNNATPPLLGVCLGMQCIAQSCGAKVVRAKKLMHGKTSRVKIERKNPLFRDLPKHFVATRYHSLVVEKSSLPQDWHIDAVSDDDEEGEGEGEEVVMAISHREHPLFGVQFHPESIACQHGERIIANFVDFCLAQEKY